MKTLMIVNPVAGRMGITRRFGRVVDLFEKNKYELDIHKTKGKGSAAEAVQKHASKCDVVVCSGGDGTLNEVVGALMKLETRPPVGYIPSGTTNDFARSFGLSRDIVTASKDVIEGNVQAVDVGKLGDNYFLYVASFGAFTQSSYTTQQDMKNVFGHFAYVLEGLKELPNIKPYKLSITDDKGNKYDGEYILGAVSNSTSIGGVIRLKDSEVDFSDGQFEVMLIKFPKNIIDLNRTILALQTNVYDDELITFFHSGKISIECDESIPWSLDGECVLPPQKFEIENLNKAVKIILPTK